MKRAILGFLIGVALAVAVPVAGHDVELLSFGAPLVSTDHPELKGIVSDLLEQAAALIARLYSGSLGVVPGGSDAKPDFLVSTVADQDKGTVALVISVTRGSDGAKSPSLAWSSPATPDLPLWIARGVFLLWSSYHGYLADTTTEQPVFVDDLPGAVLSPTMPPMGIAVTSRGTLAVALITSCLELDHAWKQVGEPGRELADKGVQLFAGGVASTPGGSLILKPTVGRDLYRVQPNSSEAQRIPTGLELSSVFYWTALSDGSALLVDATNHKAYEASPGKRRRELPLFPNPQSWPTAYAGGPDGSIWECDPALRGVRVFSAEGTPLDIVIPLSDPTSPVAPTAISVGPDGSLVLFSNGSLSRYGPDGRLAWNMTSLPGADQSALPSAASIAVDWSRGLIYLCDVAGRRISKVLDRAWCRQMGVTNELEERIIALRARGGDEATSGVAIARLYESLGSRLMAKAWWQRVQDADPGNAEAEARLLAIEIGELRASAQELDAQARTTLSRIGIETARPLSVQAIQKYELLLSKSPDDGRSRQAMESLRELFNRGTTEAEKKRPLSITSVTLSNLFPSLMHWYGLHPPGAVTVANPLPLPVEKVRASLFIPGFMDLPSESDAVERLAPGESVRVSLTPAFSQKVLELQGDMSVQAQVTITWSSAGEEQTTTRSVAATIYRNTALTWDDTRKISSYITPNEATVSGFAARAVNAGDGAAGGAPTLRLSRTFLQAMRISDAIGLYGITYVQNQDAPFSRALGKAEIIDAVHFPRITLLNRTGDCSDTTALLCALMESVGIRTAALTTPGHIFMAFDSEEPAEDAPYLRSDVLEVIPRSGTIWIPVETTVLSRGFVAAWAAASELVRKYSSTGPYEMIPVSEMRDSYPPVPLPMGAFTVAEPAPARVSAAYAATLERLTDTLYVSRLKGMETSLGSLSGRQAVKVRVQQGVLHALFGRLAEAEAAFRRAIADDPGMTSPYVNLANVKLLANDGDGALQIVKQGLAKNADSALLNLLAARLTFDRGDPSSATYFAKVQKSDPGLAARFAGLATAAGSGTASSAGASQRAADRDAAAALIWTDQ